MNVLLSVFHDSLKTNLSQHKPFDHENKNNVPEEVDEKRHHRIPQSWH